VTNKPPNPKVPAQKDKIVHPGMMGDGTEEQNLNESGDPSRRIHKDDVDAAFEKSKTKKP